MKQLSDPVLPGEHPAGTDALIDLIKEMDLAEAIAAARAFSLYFQLVNILEQRIEEDTYLESINRSQDQAEHVDPFAPPLATQTEPATFRELFERLRRLNVPPAKLEALLQELDIRLVFTAHPTEIVRHTVRHKQRRVASLLQQLETQPLTPSGQRTACDCSWKKRSGFGGEPMSSISSSHRFWMKWTTPFITSNRFCSMPCRSCGGGSSRPLRRAIQTSGFLRHRFARLDRGWGPTGMETPPSPLKSPGVQPVISAS